MPSLAFPLTVSAAPTNRYVSEVEATDTNDLTSTPYLAIEKGREDEFPSRSSPFDTKHLPSTPAYRPWLFLCAFLPPLVLNNQHYQTS